MYGWMMYGFSGGSANLKSSVSDKWHPPKYRGHLHALTQDFVCQLPHSYFRRRSTHDRHLKTSWKICLAKRFDEAGSTCPSNHYARFFVKKGVSPQVDRKPRGFLQGFPTTLCFIVLQLMSP